MAVKTCKPSSTDEHDTPTLEEMGRLLDKRAALARDPKRKKFSLKQIAARHNVRL
jgi:hypothetical protein